MTRMIMIEADALFDTRLGTVSQLSEEAARVLVSSQRYWEREHENWEALTDGLITNEQFREAYAKRDTETLFASMSTMILLVMVKIMNDFQANIVDGMVDDDVRVVVNLHRYEFSLEMQEELIQIIRLHLGKDVMVTFCDIALEALTPKEIRDRFAVVFLYNFHEWIKHHQLALASQRSPDIYMVIPKLFETDPKRLTVQEKQLQATAFQLQWLEHMDFQFIDARYFSMTQA